MFLWWPVPCILLIIGILCTVPFWSFFRVSVTKRPSQRVFCSDWAKIKFWKGKKGMKVGLNHKINNISRQEQLTTQTLDWLESFTTWSIKTNHCSYPGHRNLLTFSIVKGMGEGSTNNLDEINYLVCLVWYLIVPFQLIKQRIPFQYWLIKSFIFIKFIGRRTVNRFDHIWPLWSDK